MININSLKLIGETSQTPDEKYKTAIKAAKEVYQKEKYPEEARYQDEIKAAKEAYTKAREADNTWKYTPWFLSPGGKKTAEAHHDYHAALDAAEARREAAKQGMASKQDLDEAKYQAAKNAAAARVAKNAAAAKEGATELAPDEKPGILRRIGGAIAEHPLLAAGTVAGIAGLAALQKRRKTEQPQQY